MDPPISDSSDAYTPSYSQRDPGMNVPVHSQQNLAPLSPYLNFDPVYLPQSQPEFIFPEGAARQRGRFELAFSQIGVSCMAGAAVGGIGGLYNGLRNTTLAGHTGKLRRTQLLNYMMKQGSATANTLGVLAVMYSGFGVLISWGRGSDDDLNTLAAATATGLLYKSTAGLKKCGIGGAIGLGLASMYCLWNARDRLQGFRQEYNPASLHTFVNKCLRKVQRIWWLQVASNKDLWNGINQTTIETEVHCKKWGWISQILHCNENNSARLEYIRHKM